jgi:hypothetical protein
MRLTAKMKKAMVTIIDFAERHQIDGDNLSGLLQYLQFHRLEPTEANLLAAHKLLSERYWQEHPEERPAAPKFSWEEIARMGSDQFRQKVLSDPEFAEFVNRKKPAEVEKVEPKVIHDFGADLDDAAKAELKRLIEQKRKERGR